MLATLQDSHKHASTWQIPGILDAATCVAWAHANKGAPWKQNPLYLGHGKGVHEKRQPASRGGGSNASSHASSRLRDRSYLSHGACRGAPSAWSAQSSCRGWRRTQGVQLGCKAQVCPWTPCRAAEDHPAGRLRITLQGGWGSPCRAAEDHPTGRLKITLGWAQAQIWHPEAQSQLQRRAGLRPAACSVGPWLRLG